MQITAKVKDGEVRQSLKKLGDAIPGVTDSQMKSVMGSAKFEASGGYTGGRNYQVAPVPGSDYTRTGGYGSSFEVVRNSSKSYTLKSDHKATFFIGGNAQGQMQANVHRGRWPLISDVVRKWVETLTTEIESDLSELIRGLGIGL